MKLSKIKIYIETKTTFEKSLKQKILKFNVKDFVLSISVKCIFWQIWNEIVENQDLYRNKDDF